MEKQKISDLIYNALDYMYCDNCRHNSETHDNGYGGDPCEDCHRKSNGWAVSRSTSNYLADKILAMKND